MGRNGADAIERLEQVFAHFDQIGRRAGFDDRQWNFNVALPHHAALGDEAEPDEVARGVRDPAERVPSAQGPDPVAAGGQRPQLLDVLVLEPGSTETEFQQVAGEVSHAGEPAYHVVQVALDALGRQPSVVSGWWNWLRSNLGARLLPRALLAYIARDVMAQQTPADMR